jgi:hypothetical protein
LSDLDFIRETYSSLPDEKLIQVAQGDLNELAPGVSDILEQEFRKRGLNMADYLTTGSEAEIVEEPIPEFQSQNNSADASMMGLSYQEMMYPDDPEKELRKKEAELKFLSELKEQDLHRLKVRANWSMFLYALLFGIGMIVTLASFLTTGEEGRFVVAYGAIFAGALGFFASWNRKRKYNNQKKVFEFEEEKE